MLSWKVGDVRVTRVQELEAPGIRFILPDATREALAGIGWLAPHFMDASGEAVASVHALVIETPERRVVVDTCVGNDKQRPIPAWNQLQTAFLGNLGEAGCEPVEVDTVVCTHLHVDHVARPESRPQVPALGLPGFLGLGAVLLAAGAAALASRSRFGS